MREPIKENDNIKSCELSNEHSETVNKNMETPYKKINNNDNKPLIIIENIDKNTEPLNKKIKETKNMKTPEVEVTGGNTIENQLEKPTITKEKFQETMIRMMTEILEDNRKLRKLYARN